MITRESSADQSGFRVEASGADLAHKWLLVIDRASKLPIQILKEDDDSSLGLGELDIHNTLIHKIDARAAYIPGGDYKLMTLLIPKIDKIPSPNRSRMYRSGLHEADELSQLLGGVLGGGLAGRGISFEGFMVGGGELPVGLGLLAQVMNRRGNLPGYRVEYDFDQQEVKVIPSENASEGNEHSKFTLLGKTDVPTMPPLYFLENKEERVPENPDEFARKYGFYARLVEEVVLSLYEAKSEISPDTVFNFAPDDNTATSIKQAEQKLSFAKRQLSAAGFMEDGDDEDIDKRIVIEKPRVRFTDVGGQEKAKTELGDVVAGLADPDEFYSEGAEPPSGVMLYGPSGTGKTLLARATAGEANATIFSVGLASILHSLWGKTERYIQRIFDKAAEQAPAIIFLDEIDAIARQRSSLNQAYSSIVNVLLTNMDGMQERSRNVVVIGATNLLDLVDDALLRPGRFDMLIPVDLPDDAGRAQIFAIHRQKAIERATKPVDEIFDSHFDIAKLISSTRGFSGADIAEILRRGLVERVRTKRRGVNSHPLTAEDLIEQIALYEKVRRDKANRIDRGLGFQYAIRS